MSIRKKVEPRPRRILLIDGVDRVTICLDRSVSESELDELREHCTNLKVIHVQPKFQANRKCKLELFQPTRQCLRLLRKTLGAEINADLTYVELARDITIPKKARTALYAAFMQSVKVPHQRALFVKYKNTYYCGRRAENDDRDGSVLVLYTDRPSKLNNARPAADALKCFHVELRLSGKAALAKHGIRSLDDLIQFDHEQHWHTSLNFFVLPSKTEVGRLLAACCRGRSDASATAYLKRANRWLEKHSLDDKFVLHNALKATPALARYLVKADWSDLLESIKK